METEEEIDCYTGKPMTEDQKKIINDAMDKYEKYDKEWQEKHKDEP